MSKQPITAAELLARLADNPDYQRKLREQESQRERLATELAADEADLVAEIRDSGVDVQSVWDLVNTNGRYRPAIPILVKHLNVAHHPRTIPGIARALTTPEAKGIAFTPLVKLFQETEDAESELKWLLGAAIAEASTADNADEIIELAGNERHSGGRAFLPLGLIAAPKEKALPILESWINDATLGENARKAIQLIRLGLVNQ